MLDKSKGEIQRLTNESHKDKAKLQAFNEIEAQLNAALIERNQSIEQRNSLFLLFFKYFSCILLIFFQTFIIGSKKHLNGATTHLNFNV